MDYQITPIEIEGYSTADCVYVNSDGAWLGSIETVGEYSIALPFVDEGFDFVPAPDNWRDLIISEL